MASMMLCSATRLACAALALSRCPSLQTEAHAFYLKLIRAMHGVCQTARLLGEYGTAAAWECLQRARRSRDETPRCPYEHSEFRSLAQSLMLKGSGEDILCCDA